MYDWLVDEMAQIKTRKFHLTDGPPPAEPRKEIGRLNFPLPPSYEEFVVRFGKTNLYRRLNYWLIEVYVSPKEVISRDGECLIQFGRTHTSLAYFKKSLLVEDGESPVF